MKDRADHGMAEGQVYLHRVTLDLKSSKPSEGQEGAVFLGLLQDTQRTLEAKNGEIEHLKVELAIAHEQLTKLHADSRRLDSQGNAHLFLVIAGFSLKRLAGNSHLRGGQLNVVIEDTSPQTPIVEAKPPVSPAAREILKQKKEVLHLPPDDWAEEVSNLNSQLVTCLEELALTEKKLADYEELLKVYESRLANVDDQHTCLYIDFVKKKKVRTRRVLACQYYC